MTARRVLWVGATLVVATIFFDMAMSAEVYHQTSPVHVGSIIFGSWTNAVHHPFGLSLHVLLRKFYSIIAFAIVGLLAQQALPRSRRPALRMALLIALYSAGIEYAQWRGGSEEGLRWNAIDVACGGVGGWLAATASDLFDQRFRPAQ